MKNCGKIEIKAAAGLVSSLVLLWFLSLALAGEEPWWTQVQKAFSPLPPVMESTQNPLTPDKVRLGKILFYETRISVDGTVSCARCHPLGLYAADGLEKSIGNHCKVNPRNAPTLLNAAGQISAHWIGNRIDVEDQAKQALIGPPSFGMPSYEAALKPLKALRGYGPLFQKAFPGEANPITEENFARAVGAFERTMVTPSGFDHFLKGDQKALSVDQKQGLKTFMEAGCLNCHAGAYVGGQMYQKFGLFEPYQKYTQSRQVDEGRYVVTKKEEDRFVFKVPVLRNVAETAPYFHDGSVARLSEAIRIMGKVQLAKDLDNRQIQAIEKFLRALTGPIPEELLRLPLLPPDEQG